MQHPNDLDDYVAQHLCLTTMCEDECSTLLDFSQCNMSIGSGDQTRSHSGLGSVL